MAARALSVRQVSAEPDMAAIRALCRDYRALLAERSAALPEILETYYDEKGYEALLSDLPRLHQPPDGAIFLAELDARPVGCGMIHRIDGRTCEIKRVFVRPEARRHGAARAIFDAATEAARAAGYTQMKLDTMVALTEAIGLYRKLGFEPCAPFYDPDPRFVAHLRFFGRAL